MISKVYPELIIDESSSIGENCVIYPGVVIEENCVIGDNVTIQSGTLIRNGVSIGDGCFVGPFSVIRDGSKLMPGAKVGPHCEITRSTIGSKTVVAHRVFLGDTAIGSDAMLGCGVIVANTDFEKRFRTTIGDNSRIGVGVIIISPRSIGRNCFVAAGTTLTKDLPDGKRIRNIITHLVENN